MKESKALKTVKYFKKYGIVKTIKKVNMSIYKRIFKYTEQEKQDIKDNEDYKKWIQANEPNEQELKEQCNYKFEYNPKISIIVPLYNTPGNYFKELMESIEKQTYTNWEICFADGSPKKLEFIEKETNRFGEKVKYRFLNENMGISGNSNEALKLATGDYIALLDHDDILPLFSLFEIVKTINENPNADFIYTDEDKILEDKENRISPHFKQDFAPDTLMSYNYICHFSIFKKELMEKLGGFNKEFDGSQDYDLILRATENAKKIVHIPKILYNWRISSNSVASGAEAKPYAYVAAKKAILAHLNRIGVHGADVVDSKIMGLYRVKYQVEGNPKVSIIILNKNHKKDLKRCINSIKNSTYTNYEIIIVENDSDEKSIFDYYEKLKEDEKVKIVTCNLKQFNYSKLNNYGVKNSTGEYIILLNNDIKIISRDWIETLLGNCQRKDVGIVGAKLMYPNEKIQHAGVMIYPENIAMHINWGEDKDNPGYMGRIMIQQNVMAVTGALLIISREDYLKEDGLDENLPVAYNDVDLCLKTIDHGKLIVYNPYVEAYHYESKSRGYEDTEEKKKRLEKDAHILRKKWDKFFEKPDPYFSINFRKDVPNMKVKIDKI